MAGTINFRRRSSSVCCDSSLPWDKFHYWIHCICVVTFDLEIGQTLEFILPKGVKLTEKEKTNICYLSFPDSNSGCAGDTVFHFRIRCDNQNSCDLKHTEFIKSFNRCTPASLLSFVILTKLPFVNLFYQLVEKIAVEFFRFSLPSLETACNEIDHWPLPKPGSSLNLPLMGAIIQALATSTCFIASAYEPNFYEYLSPVLSHLHLLWEVVLLGEPLAVMASSPSICSNVVHSLVTLIFPFRPHPDYRPFFTIHDSEFREFTSKTNRPPNIVVGVTNPFFTKTLEHWPNVLRIGDNAEISSTKSSPALNHKVKKGGNLKILDSKPGLYTKYKPFLTKDKTFLKKILKAAPCVAPFKEDEFFCMLENSGSHFTSSIKGDWIGLYKQFFAGPIFKLWLEQRQQEIDEKLQMLHLEVLCAAPLYSSTMTEKREIELIDIVLKLRDKLKFVDDNKDRVSQQTRSRLVEHYQVFLDALPDDMKSVLQSNSNNKLLPRHSSVSNRSASASPPFHP